jgi:hypothetical protein
MIGMTKSAALDYQPLLSKAQQPHASDISRLGHRTTLRAGATGMRFARA